MLAVGAPENTDIHLLAARQPLKVLSKYLVKEAEVSEALYSIGELRCSPALIDLAKARSRQSFRGDVIEQVDDHRPDAAPRMARGSQALLVVIEGFARQIMLV